MAKAVSKTRKLVAFLAAVICIALAIALYCMELEGKDFPSGSNFKSSDDFVRMIDVGQGDCTLIYSNGYSALIDTGTNESANEVLKVLDECDIDEIDVLILSHLHDDHTGGVGKIAEFYGIKNVILPEISIESEGLTDAELAINKVRSVGGGIYNAVSGLNFSIGEFEITVLASYGDMRDENNRSIFVVAKTAGRKFLFTGDAEEKAERKLLEEGLNLKCDVLKVGHHGSNTSSSEEFLKAVRPRYAAISAGIGNTYDHPHNEILASFEKLDTKIYRTDYNGDITFYIENGNIKVKTEK